MTSGGGQNHAHHGHVGAVELRHHRPGALPSSHLVDFGIVHYSSCRIAFNKRSFRCHYSSQSPYRGESALKKEISECFKSVPFSDFAPGYRDTAGLRSVGGYGICDSFNDGLPHTPIPTPLPHAQSQDHTPIPSNFH